MFPVGDDGWCTCSKADCNGKRDPHSAGKHPRWSAGQSTADTSWWQANPGDAVGIDREGSRVVSVEEDGALTAWAAANGIDLVPTFAMASPRENERLFYRLPADFTQVRNWTDVDGKDSADILCKGRAPGPGVRGSEGEFRVTADLPVADATVSLLAWLVRRYAEWDAASPDVVPAEDFEGELPESVLTALAAPGKLNSDGTDTDRSAKTYAVVLACYDAGLSQGETAGVVEDHCQEAVEKYGARRNGVTGEVARIWGGLDDDEPGWLAEGRPPSGGELSTDVTKRYWALAQRRGIALPSAAPPLAQSVATVSVGQPAPYIPPPGGQPRKPGLDAITGLILDTHEFVRDAGGELFALPGPALASQPYIPLSFLTRDVMNLAHDTWRNMAGPWNAWLKTQDEKTQQTLGHAALTPSDTLIRNCVSHLEALGMRHGRKAEAQLRAVEVGDSIVIDLGDDTGRVVHVTASGWKVTDPRELPFPAPLFRRSLGYLPLPAPQRGGDLGDLFRILHVDDETVQALSTGWLIGSFFAGASRPGLWFTGVPGCGKTTLGGSLARLADGTEWLDGRLDKSDERNNIIRAAKHYVVSFDNMSAVTADTSDWLCTLITGHRDTFRKMRTNFDDISMAYKRTFIATGLSLPYGLGADALDRIIEVPLSPIAEKKRVTDEGMRAELDAARPQLLGALLDHVVGVLKTLPYVPADAGITRMNRYGHILAAHDTVYNTGCLKAYLESVHRMREDRAAAEPVVLALRKLFDQWPRGWWPCMCGGSHPHQPVHTVWQGTPAELLDALPMIGTFWPTDPRALSDKLTEADPVLRAAGFTVDRKRTTVSQPKRQTIRVIRITRE